MEFYCTGSATVVYVVYDSGDLKFLCCAFCICFVFNNTKTLRRVVYQENEEEQRNLLRGHTCYNVSVVIARSFVSSFSLKSGVRARERASVRACERLRVPGSVRVCLAACVSPVACD